MLVYWLLYSRFSKPKVGAGLSRMESLHDLQDLEGDWVRPTGGYDVHRPPLFNEAGLLAARTSVAAWAIRAKLDLEKRTRRYL